jgi:hypothetical protein
MIAVAINFLRVGAYFHFTRSEERQAKGPGESLDDVVDSPACAGAFGNISEAFRDLHRPSALKGKLWQEVRRVLGAIAP